MYAIPSNKTGQQTVHGFENILYMGFGMSLAFASWISLLIKEHGYICSSFYCDEMTKKVRGRSNVMCKVPKYLLTAALRRCIHCSLDEGLKILREKCMLNAASTKS